jgi:hypothetical protein
MRARQTRYSVFHPCLKIGRSILAGPALLNVVGYRGSLLETIPADSRDTRFSDMCASIMRASVRHSRAAPCTSRNGPRDQACVLCGDRIREYARGLAARSVIIEFVG